MLTVRVLRWEGGGNLRWTIQMQSSKFEIQSLRWMTNMQRKRRHDEEGETPKSVQTHVRGK